MANNREFCIPKLVILHVSHIFLWLKCLTLIFKDGGPRHLGLRKNGGLTQKRPLTFEISYIWGWLVPNFIILLFGSVHVHKSRVVRLLTNDNPMRLMVKTPSDCKNGIHVFYIFYLRIYLLFIWTPYLKSFQTRYYTCILN